MTRTRLWPDLDLAMNARHPDPFTVARPAPGLQARADDEPGGPALVGRARVRRATILAAVLAGHLAGLFWLIAPPREPRAATEPPILVTLLPAAQVAPETPPAATQPRRRQPARPQAEPRQSRAVLPAPARPTPNSPITPRPMPSEASPPATNAAAPATEPAPSTVSVVPSNPSVTASTTSAPPTPARFDAAYLNNQTPYPPLARRLKETGTVRLRVLVSAHGSPERIELISSSGSPRLDDGALEAVRRWRFIPARQGDQAVASTVVVPIIYKLEEF